MDDEKIIELFFARSQQAIAETQKKYGRLFHSIAANIVGNSFDADECVNDTLLGAWNAIPPARPTSLCAYLCKTARNIALRRYYNSKRAQRNGVFETTLDELEQVVADSSSTHAALEAKELSRAIEAFLLTLSSDDRVIFMRRYAFCESYQSIAKLVGLSEKNVSVRLVRIRKQLKNHLERNELYG